MNQPVDMSTPCEDGIIATPFSKVEWKYMRQVLKEDLIYHHGLINDKSEIMSREIIDRIEKILGAQ